MAGAQCLLNEWMNEARHFSTWSFSFFFLPRMGTIIPVSCIAVRLKWDSICDSSKQGFLRNGMFKDQYGTRLSKSFGFAMATTPQIKSLQNAFYVYPPSWSAATLEAMNSRLGKLISRDAKALCSLKLTVTAGSSLDPRLPDSGPRIPRCEGVIPG